jgi:hypothetical protein
VVFVAQSGLGSIALFAHAKGQPKIVQGFERNITGKTELRGSAMSGNRKRRSRGDQYPKGGMPLQTYDIDARGVVVSIVSK